MTFNRTQEDNMTEVPAKPLDEIKDFARRFVVFADEAHYDVLALWTLHTYAVDAAYSTPYLYVNSAEPQSGKTRTLEVAESLARNPTRADNTTPAALFRQLADSEPTMFLDEVDTVFTGGQAKEDLRGVLNSGYKRGAMIPRFTGTEVEHFPTFCPKMLVGIDNGAMPDTLADRCIPMILKRKKTDVQVDRWIPRKVEPQASALKDRIQSWAIANYDAILDAPDPEFLEGISDRKFEIVEPLLVLALIAGGKQYANKMRREFTRLLAGQAPKASKGVQALIAAKELFESEGVKRFPSMTLADKLGMTGKELATVLSRYDVKPANLYIAGKYHRGYDRKAFEDAWTRYL